MNDCGVDFKPDLGAGLDGDNVLSRTGLRVATDVGGVDVFGGTVDGGSFEGSDIFELILKFAVGNEFGEAV